MATGLRCVVLVETPLQSTVGAAAAELRSWLDRRRIETTVFRPLASHDTVVFEIGFTHAADAELFRQEFDGASADAEMASADHD